MFHLLHCNTCGREKIISFEEIGEPHLKYLKGLSYSNDTATQENDEDVHANYPGPTISEEEYFRVVEEMAGHCECGGQFKFDASPDARNVNRPISKKTPMVSVSFMTRGNT
jgi:hypothetical protein